MDTQPRSSDWRSILLLIFSLGGVLVLISGAIGILIVVIMNESVVRDVAPSPLATILTASALIVLGLLLLPIAWLSLGRLRGRAYETFSLSPLRPWEWIAIPGLWLLALTLATLFYDAPGANWYAPILHFLSIALPIYLVLRILLNRIPLGSSQRAWGVFGSGMTISPLLAVIGEGIVILFGMVAFGVYLGFNPGKMLDFQRLINQIQRAPDLETLVFQLGPLLKNPLTLLTALALLSACVPFIEESLKSLGVWLVADRLSSPAQGFAMGALSGAGFALSESLFASVTADNSWAVTLSMRAISGTMHILAAGLVGWGIAYARLERRYLRLFGVMIIAMLLHGTWNAGAVFAAAGGAGVMLATPGFDFFSTILMLAGAGLIFFLTSGMIIALFAVNKRLRNDLPPPAQSAATFPLSRVTGGEGEGG